MNVGIYDLSNFLDYKRRLETYKDADFREVALYIDNVFLQTSENYEDIISYARKIGLKVKQVHIDYHRANAICDGSKEYLDYVEGRLSECERLHIPCMVLHASKGDNPPILSTKNFEKIENLAKKHNSVTLCFENVRNNTNLDLILQSNLNNIKMCFDLGHAHAYGNEKALFEKYKDKIVCSHLHNNFGKDTHNLLRDGEIDVEFFAKLLENCQSNCLECFPSRDAEIGQAEFAQFVKMCSEDVKKFG